MIKTSLIIPTYQRESSLLKTIEVACRLDFPRENYEIIVVDNGNTNKTSDSVKKLIRLKKIKNLRLIRENNLGLHFARHTGAKIARGELLIFTDDDAILDKNLLKAYTFAFAKYTNMVAAGGPVKPVWGEDLPKWLSQFMGKNRIFTPFSLMETHKVLKLHQNLFFFGVNMAIRKTILFDLGGFNPELIGDIYVGDGEAGLIRKIRNNNLLIGYVPQAIVYHFIPKERMTLSYLTKRMVNEGASNMYEKYHPGIPNKPKLMISLISLLAKNIKLFLAAEIKRGRTDINSLNIQLEAARIYGQIVYIFNIIKNESLRALILKKDWLKKD